MSSKTKLLITGATGKVASFLIPHLAQRYDLVLTDIREPATKHHTFIKADINDLQAMQTVCKGVSTVLHLAASSHETDPWESLLSNNIVGVYTIFQAAHEAGCQRVVFASSVHAVLGYPRETQVHPNMPVRPGSIYGATKAWGEAVARFYADQKDMSCICLRFGWVQARNSPIIKSNEYALDVILTFEDLTKLIIAGIDAPADLRFGIFHGISNNRWKRFDISNARTTLGYYPEDDAFALAGMELKPTLWKRVRRRLRRHLNI